MRVGSKLCMAAFYTVNRDIIGIKRRSMRQIPKKHSISMVDFSPCFFKKYIVGCGDLG